MKQIMGIIVTLCLLVACGATTSQPSSQQPTSLATMEKPTETMMTDPTADAMMEKPTATMMAEPTAETMAEQPTAEAMGGDQLPPPAWQTAQLVDARTGETFRLADFKGKTVFVEAIATWCSKCLQQLKNVREARTKLPGDTHVFIALSVETNLAKEELAAYTNDQGFDWLFAVATPELLQELVDEFGRSITNPPSTPHFVISPDGEATPLRTGIDTPDQLVMLLSDTGA